MSIADDVQRDLHVNLSEPDAAQADPGRPVSNVLNGRAQSYMGELLDAQQRLISAHHQFLHDSDMHALARAQLDVINVHNGVLDRLGVFGR